MTKAIITAATPSDSRTRCLISYLLLPTGPRSHLSHRPVYQQRGFE